MKKRVVLLALGLVLGFARQSFAADQVTISAFVDYKKCNGHPDDPKSSCWGEWSKLVPLTMELHEVPGSSDDGTIVDKGYKHYQPVINGIRFEASIVVERWTRNQKARYYIEAKVGKDLASDDVVSTDLFVDSLEQLNQINLISPWEKEGERYAKAILRVGPPLKD